MQKATKGFIEIDSPPSQGGVSRPQRRDEGVPEYKKESNLPALKTRRKALRKKLTPAEATLWGILKSRQLKGRKFRRQYSIGNFIIDFFCPEERLGIELDGEIHMDSSAIEKDNNRSMLLEIKGIKILRFENRMVFQMPESLLGEIVDNFGWWHKH
jgi:very-short-patch-repair endonuclease